MELDVAALGLGLYLKNLTDRDRTHQLIGLFHLLSVQWYIDIKIQQVPRLWFFQRLGCCLQIYFSRGEIWTVSCPFWGGKLIFFSGIIFFQRSELSKIKYQDIYEPNNHSFQGILLFKIFLVHTPAPVRINNGMTQWDWWISPCLLVDLMMMILNWNKTDDGCSTLICVQKSIKSKFILGKVK